MNPTINWNCPWGLVSDAHGNPLGLQLMIRLLRERNAATLFFLGDAVGYLPRAAEVVAILRAEGLICLKGNHDAMLLGNLPLDEWKDAVYRLRAAGAALSVSDWDFMRAWPERLDLTHPENGRKHLLLHGGLPDVLQTYTYADTRGELFVREGCDVVFCGHTHRPFIRREAGLLLVNTGSCGLPRDVGDSASGALYDPVSGRVEIVRGRFDAEAVIRANEQDLPLPAAVCDCLRRRENTGEAV